MTEDSSLLRDRSETARLRDAPAGPAPLCEACGKRHFTELVGTGMGRQWNGSPFCLCCGMPASLCGCCNGAYSTIKGLEIIGQELASASRWRWLTRLRGRRLADAASRMLGKAGIR